MHDTALSIGKLFFDTYAPLALSARTGLSEGLDILDVGSMDVNGSLRSVAPFGFRYTGVDIAQGPGVDVVSPAGEPLPMAPESFDLVVSTSCFEHDMAFWSTIYEMVRVLRPGGYLYINAPSNGIYHAHPLDCWRFYADSGVALAEWVTKCGLRTQLVESFTARRGPSGWNDFVMVFARAPLQRLPKTFLGDQVPSYNARKRGLISGLLRPQAESEEQQIQRYLATNAGSLLGRWLALGNEADTITDPRLKDDTADFLKTFGLTT